MEDKSKKVLQKNIKKYRLLGKLDGVEYCKSSAAFAEHIGLNRKTYKNYESGTSTPDYDNLLKIAAALGLPSIDKLLEYQPPAGKEIRFFLDDLGIPFRTKKVSGGTGEQKKYILCLPEKIKNDVRTVERMTFDVDAAEVKIYESPALRRDYSWFDVKEIPLFESDFAEIVSFYHEHEAQLKTFSKYPFIRQLLFLGLAKAYNDMNIGDADTETATEYGGIVSFLMDLETFFKDVQKAKAQSDWYSIRKENDTWVQSDFLNLQDKMNDELETENLREVFLDMLAGMYKETGRGGLNVIRQQIKTKK